MYTVRYTDGFLMHFGVGHLNGGHSGRYPWGSGEEGGERKRGLFGRKKSKSATPLTDEQKTEYLTKGNAKKVYEHRSEFTYQELDNFVKKLSKENDLKKLAYGEKKSKVTMLKDTASILGDIAKIYTSYTDMQIARQKHAKAESEASTAETAAWKASSELIKAKAEADKARSDVKRYKTSEDFAKLAYENAKEGKDTAGASEYWNGVGVGSPTTYTNTYTYNYGDKNKKKKKKK